MKKLFGILFLFLAVMFMTGCEVIPPGHVAVKVNKVGDDRGVAPEVVGPGRQWFGWNVDYFLFPTFTQTDKWAASKHEGRAEDQSITFQAAGGIAVTTDIAISYRVEKENVVKVFVKYRRGIEEISDSFLRNIVRDELNKIGVKYDVESLQGAGKEEMLAKVTSEVKRAAADIGVTVESLSYLSSLRFPPNVVNSINAKIQATQDAMKVENEVRQTRAEQEKKVVVAEAQVKVAEAEAKSIRLRGEALRANGDVLKIRELENQEMAIKKWDGKLPQYTGGTAPQTFIGVK